jgi:hypothetical protein
MQVFFSWSGEASRLAATALASCVSDVIQAVEPWLSEAIAKGAQWRDQLNTGLEKSRIGVCCLTRENLKAEWILFEAGAISKTKDAHLCTFLLDVKPTDVAGPLAAFQHTVPEKDDVKKLLQLINTTVLRAGEKGLTDAQLDKYFDRSWPDLEAELANARNVAPMTKVEREPRELLEEILEHVRQNAWLPTDVAQAIVEDMQRRQNAQKSQHKVLLALEKKKRAKQARLVEAAFGPPISPADAAFGPPMSPGDAAFGPPGKVPGAR